jgi:hypothetical protein
LAAAATPANAGDVTANQLRALQIPKRHDTAVNPAPAETTSADIAPANLDGLKIGNGLRPANAGDPTSPLGPSPTAPLNGLSLEGPSLGASAPSSPTSSSPPALSRQGGNIVYSIIPSGGFTPYIGLGGGGAAGKLDNGQAGGSDNLRSYDGLAGFAYKLDKDTRLDLDYRMSNTQRPSVPIDNDPDIADAGRDRAAILSLHYDLNPVFRQPPE